MSPAVWPRCSFVADAAGDQLEGTAPPVEQWFLVEHEGPWDRHGASGAALGPVVRSRLSAWAAGRAARSLLIRRPASRHSRPAERREPVARQWFRVDSRIGQEGVRTGWFHDEEGLARAVDDAGTAHDAPLYLTCAHGRHDTCCAVRGRPVAAALAEREPGNAWECSHLGGCRFAPTVVVLPHGLVLGRVEPGDVVRLLDATRRGLVVPDLLRGRTSLPPVVQSAQHHARIATGVQGVDALRLVSLDRQDNDRWLVRLADPDCTVLVAGHRTELGRPLTCAASADGHQQVFTLQRITVP